jgi:hypothetical protein
MGEITLFILLFPICWELILKKRSRGRVYVDLIIICVRTAHQWCRVFLERLVYPIFGAIEEEK